MIHTRRVTRVTKTVRSFAFSGMKELSDYYHVQLTSKDIDKKLSGEFTTGSIDEIVDLIENVLQVTIQKN